MNDQPHPQLDWELSRLAEEATRAIIESAGVIRFEQFYAHLERQLC